MRLLSIAALCALIPLSSAAQPSLDSLWPTQDGLTWQFEIRAQNHMVLDGFVSTATLTLNGTVDTPGGVAHVLEAVQEGNGLAKAMQTDTPIGTSSGSGFVNEQDEAMVGEGIHDPRMSTSAHPSSPHHKPKRSSI